MSDRLMIVARVVCTQGDMVVIGPEVLETVDADTTPGELVYDVHSQMTNGRLAFVDSPQRNVSTFTQEDIDNRRVVFLHHGSRENFAIYLKVGSA